MNIYEKMLAATVEVGNVAKNLEVGIGKNRYKATGEADVLAAVKKIEAKYGIYSYPISRKIVASDTYTTTKTYDNGNSAESTTLFMRLEIVYRFLNIEKPDEYIDIVSYGDGVDTNDKAPGKAMTYADKYALMKAYKIITGDDPDQDASGDIGKKAAKAQITPITVEQRSQMIALGMKLEDVAAYLKKAPNEITAEELQQAINLKLARKAKKEEAAQNVENGNS